MTAPASPQGLWFASFIHQDGTRQHVIISADTEDLAWNAMKAEYGQLVRGVLSLVPLTLDRIQDLFELDPTCPLVITLSY